MVQDELFRTHHPGRGLLYLFTDPVDTVLLKDLPPLHTIANYAVGTDKSTSMPRQPAGSRWATRRASSQRRPPTSPSP